jgi:transcriptional regulator with XRE-family HTH domain
MSDRADITAIRLWFDDGSVFIETDKGEILSQSLKWYPLLRKATSEERAAYRFTDEGIRWDGIDEDISFESFLYDDTAGKTPLRTIFDAFPELNVSKVAARMGIPQSVFAAYLCGAKNPSETRLKEIAHTLHDLGRELSAVAL